MQSKLADRLTYDDIIKDCKTIGIEVTWRTLNYYKSLGLLPKPTKVEGSKRGYYPTEITNDLILYHFLQNDIGFTLKEIKDLRNDFKIIDDYLNTTPALLGPFLAYSVVGNFAYIINVTYAAYIEAFINDPKSGEYFKTFGVNSIILLNKTYKFLITHFRKNALTSILKEGITRKSYESYIKDWGRKSARAISKEVALWLSRPRTIND